MVGAGERPDWTAAVERTNGRIVTYPERAGTSVLYDAADIYVDSFPAVSITSLLEAGSLGIPLVTRDPFGEASTIWAPTHRADRGTWFGARDLHGRAAALGGR